MVPQILGEMVAVPIISSSAGGSVLGGSLTWPAIDIVPVSNMMLSNMTVRSVEVVPIV